MSFAISPTTKRYEEALGGSRENRYSTFKKHAFLHYEGKGVELPDPTDHLAKIGSLLLLLLII